jgi:hypothetical protein
MFEPERDKVVGGWRKLHNNDVRNWVILFCNYNEAKGSNECVM